MLKKKKKELKTYQEFKYVFKLEFGENTGTLRPDVSCCVNDRATGKLTFGSGTSLIITTGKLQMVNS